MGGNFIHIRVEQSLKENSEKILTSLGLTMTTGIHLFLNSVIQNRGIPFEIKQGRDALLGSKVANLERSFQNAAKDMLEHERTQGHPIALFDKEKKRSYLEYPDGMRVYADG